MTAIRAETDQVKAELRRQVTTRLFGQRAGHRQCLAVDAWRSQDLPTVRAVAAAGGPGVHQGAERHRRLRARRADPRQGRRKFLAIPTGFNAARGARAEARRGMRVTPAQMVASGQAFLRPFKSGRGFVWCLPLRQGEQTGRRRRTRWWPVA